MKGETVWSLRQWAEEIVALKVGPLPARTVIVPRLRVAQALKRELALLDSRVLVGTMFVTPSLAAREVLSLAGVQLESGEEAVRPVRLQHWFAQRPALRHFDLEVLRNARGWAEAFARTLGQLEAAGISAADLRGRGSDQLEDLALALEWLGRAAGNSVTNDVLVARAAQVLEAGGAWPWAGESLAVVSGHESGVIARLVRAVPRVTVRLLGARPAVGKWVVAPHPDPLPAGAGRGRELEAHRAHVEAGLAVAAVAAADVVRALEALSEIGVEAGQTDGFAVEYPVAMPQDGQLLGGFIDLVATKGGLTVIDFKTDTAPRGDVVTALPQYAEQVRSYARILEHGGLAAAGTVKTALLFTETGAVAWIPR